MNNTLETEIGEKMHRVMSIRKRKHHSHHHDMPDMTRDQFHIRKRILFILAEKSGINQKDFAAILGVRPQSLGEQLIKMEDDLLINREINPNDKRQTLIFLSEKGKEFLRDMESLHNHDDEEFYGCLNKSEKQALSNILTKIIEYNIGDDVDATNTRGRHKPI